MNKSKTEQKSTREVWLQWRRSVSWARHSRLSTYEMARVRGTLLCCQTCRSQSMHDIATHESGHPSQKTCGAVDWRAGAPSNDEETLKIVKEIRPQIDEPGGNSTVLQNLKDREPRKRIVGFDEVGHIAVNGIRLLERHFDAKVDKIPNVRRFPLARKSTLKLIGKLRHLMKKLSGSNTCINPKEHTPDLPRAGFPGTLRTCWLNSHFHYIAYICHFILTHARFRIRSMALECS